MNIRRYVIAIGVTVCVTLGRGVRPEAVEPMFELPAPTGPFAVGTTSWALSDASRQETLGGAPGPRQIQVVAWYPASAATGAATAPYLRAGLAEAQAFARLLRQPAEALDGLAGVRTHGVIDARIASSPRRLPLLLFSHGYTAVPSAYTGLLEDLASHGYVVLSVVHAYEAAAATLPGGRTVTLLNDTGSLIPGVRDVSTEWTSEDASMTAVTAAEGEEAQRSRLREYFSTLTHTVTALRRWTDDDRLALDRLLQASPSAAGGSLSARIDRSRIGAFGHSMGGVTAAQFCLDDKRCAAVLNLDGIPQYGPMIDTMLDRPLLMVYSARPGRAGASDAIYRPAAARYFRVDVAGTRHLDFSDMVFWPPLRELGALGSVEPVRALSLTRTIVREFFDQELRGTPSPLLAGRTVPEGVRVSASQRRAAANGR